MNDETKIKLAIQTLEETFHANRSSFTSAQTEQIRGLCEFTLKALKDDKSGN